MSEITADGGICVWDSGELSLGGLMKALTAVGKEGLMPRRSNKKASLKEAAVAFAKKALRPPRGKPVQAFPLAESVCGFDVKQMNADDKSVDPVHVVTVVADDDDKVSIIGYNGQLLPKIAEHQDKCEQWLQGYYGSRRLVVHANIVTSVVNNLMRELKSTPVKTGGGCYWVPDSQLPVINTFCDALKDEWSDFRIVVWKSTVAANEKTFKQVADSIKEQMHDRLDAVTKSLVNLEKRQNENGKNSRTAECYAVLDLVKEYETFLGAAAEDYRKMAEEVMDAVNTSAVMDLCS